VANPKNATSVSGGPLVTVTEIVRRNAAAAESPGVGAIGTINDVSNSINEFGKFDVRKTTKTATVGQDSGWISYTDRYGTSYVRSFQNMQSVPTNGFTDKTNNSLSFRKNEFGLWDGNASRVAVRGGGGGTPDDDVDVSYNITIDGVAYTISEKITSSLTRAQSHVSGNNTGGSGKTPGIVYIGKGKYKATKVTI